MYSLNKQVFIHRHRT